MTKPVSVRMNFVMNFVLTISNFIFPLITFPYVSRMLGASGVGTVSFVTSNVTYFAMVAMLGIPTYGIRATATVRDDKDKLSKTVLEIMLINSLVTLVALFALLTTVAMVPKFTQEKELYWIMSSMLIFNLVGVEWLYKGLERYAYITIRSILFKFLSVILLFLLVRQESDYVLYGAITVFAGVGSNLMNFINLRKVINWHSIKDLQFKPHLRPIITFFLLTVSTTIYLNVDTTLLGFMKGDEAVGYYSAAVKIKQILVSVVTSLGAVLLPRLSFYYEQGKEAEFKALTQKALNFVFVLALPLVLYFTIMAEESILFLSGNSFLPATLPMQLIMPTVLFIGLSNLMGIQILVPTNREKLVVLSTLVGAGVDLFINLFVIPLFSATGAAFAGSVAELSVALVQLMILRNLLMPMFKSLAFGKIALALLLASFPTFFISQVLTLSTFMTLVVTASLFFGLYGLTLLVLREPFVTQFSQSLLAKIK